MKTDASSMEIVAELLPDERRERFFALIARLENVPEDDEHLRILEAMGFLTLIMKAIPTEIAESVKKSQSGLNDPQRQALQSDIETILKDSIDTPSYKDLRTMVREMKEQNDTFDDRVGQLMEWLRKRVPQASTSTKPRWMDRLIGFAVALVLLGSVGYALMPSPGKAPSRSPLGMMESKGILRYFEDQMPEYGGKVGVIVASEALEAVSREGQGILIVLPEKL